MPQRNWLQIEMSSATKWKCTLRETLETDEYADCLSIIVKPQLTMLFLDVTFSLHDWDINYTLILAFPKRVYCCKVVFKYNSLETGLCGELQSWSSVFTLHLAYSFDPMLIWKTLISAALSAYGIILDYLIDFVLCVLQIHRLCNFLCF